MEAQAHSSAADTERIGVITNRFRFVLAWAAWGILPLLIVGLLVCGGAWAIQNSSSSGDYSGLGSIIGMLMLTLCVAVFGVPIAFIFGTSRQASMIKSDAYSFETKAWTSRTFLLWVLLVVVGVGAYGWYGSTFLGFYSRLDEVASRGIGYAALYSLPALFLGLIVGALGGLVLGAAQQGLLRIHLPLVPWIRITVLTLSVATGLAMYMLSLGRIMYEKAYVGTPYYDRPSEPLMLLLPLLTVLLLGTLVPGVVLAMHLYPVGGTASAPATPANAGTQWAALPQLVVQPGLPQQTQQLQESQPAMTRRMPSRHRPARHVH